MTDIPTKTDANLGPWPNDDKIVRLRERGPNRIHLLSTDASRELVIGTLSECDVRLVDPERLISRRHAVLKRDGERWVICDRSKNGLTVDGVACTEQVLLAGAEIEIGRTRLVAESHRLIALRSYLARLLGWATTEADRVDEAVRAVREASIGRNVLVLCGRHELVALAAGLHDRVLGADRPFVVCDPRRQPGEASARAPENFEQGVPALAAAVGGSLCVRARRPPRDFKQVLAALSTARVQLIMCAEKPAECKPYAVKPVVVPSLSDRATEEVDHVILEYFNDAMASLPTADRIGFTLADRAWVRTYEVSSLPVIEKATRRLVALRQEGGNLPRASARLGITRAALSKWIGRRQLPMLTSDPAS